MNNKYNHLIGKWIVFRTIDGRLRTGTIRGISDYHLMLQRADRVVEYYTATLIIPGSAFYSADPPPPTPVIITAHIPYMFGGADITARFEGLSETGAIAISDSIAEHLEDMGKKDFMVSWKFEEDVEASAEPLFSLYAHQPRTQRKGSASTPREIPIAHNLKLEKGLEHLRDINRVQRDVKKEEFKASIEINTIVYLGHIVWVYDQYYLRLMETADG